ncbi:unnamed protein product, partial [Brachionus calyciflorus]
MYKIFLYFYLINSKICYALICYACNSNWEACGADPNYSLIRYNKEICRGPCRIWKNGQTIHRGCSNRFIPNNATFYTDKNGLLYKYCYSDLCNTNYIETEFQDSQFGSNLFSSSLKPTISENNLKNDTIYCYFCNERWKSCADPPNLEDLKHSLIECNGVCVTWLNELDENRIYRGCLKNVNLLNLNIFKENNNILYNYCSTNLCNSAPLSAKITNSSSVILSNLTTLTTTTIITTQTNTINIVIKDQARIISPNVSKNLDYDDEDSLIESSECFEDYNLDDKNENNIENEEDSFEITVDLEINSTMTNSDSTKIPSYELNDSRKKIIRCYFCNARWR